VKGELGVWPAPQGIFWNVASDRRKRPLFEKAAQKFWFCWVTGAVADIAHALALAKFFCFFLFTKRSFPLRFLRRAKRMRLKISRSRNRCAKRLFFLLSI
jgi:hypothetical protein